jgi:hypothetical protein
MLFNLRDQCADPNTVSFQKVSKDVLASGQDDCSTDAGETRGRGGRKGVKGATSRWPELLDHDPPMPRIILVEQ